MYSDAMRSQPYVNVARGRPKLDHQFVEKIAATLPANAKVVYKPAREVLADDTVNRR
jgi:hypothetical protein